MTGIYASSAGLLQGGFGEPQESNEYFVTPAKAGIQVISSTGFPPSRDSGVVAALAAYESGIPFAGNDGTNKFSVLLTAAILQSPHHRCDQRFDLVATQIGIGFLQLAHGPVQAGAA